MVYRTDKMRRVILVSICFFLGLVPLAQAEKIAYVDAVRLMDQAPQRQDEVKKLEVAFGQRNRDINAALELFRTKKAELEKNSVLLSKEEIEAKTIELRELQRELERKQRAYNEDFADSRNAMLSRMEKIISKVIIDIARQEKIDLVLQQVVYASERIDLTDAVLEELNKRYQQ